MSWDRFFLYLGRFNAIIVAMGVIFFGGFLATEYFRSLQSDSDWQSNLNDGEFGAEANDTNSIIGHPIDTTAGKIVAYYESDEDFERKELAGLVLVNLANSRTLPIAEAETELLVDFEFLFDQGDKDRPVRGYIARVATEAEYRAGRSNLIIGALPAMTKNVVAQNVRFVDTPTVRSDGYVALVMWQENDRGEVLAFNLDDGSVIDRAQIKVPVVDRERMSQGPAKSFDAALLRQSNYGAAPTGPREF